MIRKTLLILLSAAGIALSGCGQNSIAGTAPAESGTKVESTSADVGTTADEGTESDKPTTANETTTDGEGAAVSYLGPAGTYTEEAAQFFFPEAENMMPKGTVDEAIAEVMNGTADYAVIPQEQIDKISGIEEVRLVGKFRSVEKTP